MPLDGIELATLIAIALVAAVVRGYSGFGFSAIVIAGASLVIAPAALVPALYMLEIVASIHMLPGVRREIDYPNFWPMLVGCAVGLPAGQFLLTHLPADTIRIFLSLGVLASTALIWRGYRFKTQMNPPLAGVTGLVIGFGSGMASVGGLLAMVIFLGANYPPAKTRAIFVAIFGVMYVYGTLVSALNGLITATTFWIVATCLLPLFAGILLGQKRWLAATPESFRSFALGLLAVLAVAGIARALLI